MVILVSNKRKKYLFIFTACSHYGKVTLALTDVIRKLKESLIKILVGRFN